MRLTLGDVVWVVAASRVDAHQLRCGLLARQPGGDLLGYLVGGGGNCADNALDMLASVLNDCTNPVKLASSGFNNAAIVSFSDSPLGSLESAAKIAACCAEIVANACVV